MERIFPFKNIAINSFWEFMHPRFIEKYYIEFKQNEDEDYAKFIEDEIQRFKDNLTNFENEILQIINTTNQETIDHFFAELKDNLYHVKKVDKELLLQIVFDHNEMVYNSFLEEVTKKSDEYFNKEERTKYKHLEKYQGFNFLGLGFHYSSSPKKVELTNYNFYCVEDLAPVLDMKYFYDYDILIKELLVDIYTISEKYISLYDQGLVKADIEKFFHKTIVYVEGDHDISFIRTASDHLKFQQLLDKIELRQRNGFRNLDKIWAFYNSNSLEIIAQKKILLYDCDTFKQDENFGNFLFKRVIPTFNEHLISKGIENLFSNFTVQKAIKQKKEFIDRSTKRGVVRGVEFYEEINVVNKDEKLNFCKWICDNGTKEDFKYFEVLFKILEEIVENNID